MGFRMQHPGSTLNPASMGCGGGGLAETGPKQNGSFGQDASYFCH